ncbi:MAG: glycoside hydrolase family 97 catalytic domain-containing protein [Bacteroidaceae bacterium]|nr:glycoside hydrolase family 97 catalytic domain-containing protein [Bacteroidaceae bacterium]
MHLSGHYRIITPVVGTSPDGRLSVRQQGSGLSLYYDGTPVIDIPSLGYDGNGQPALSFVRHLKEDYKMISGKRLHCTNEANEYRMDGGITVRIYNDGLAFRSETPGQAQPAYLIPEGTRRWMQQWSDGYEGFFPLSTTYKVQPVPSYSGISKSAEGWNNRWGYPALLEPSDGLYCLITEANIVTGQSASCLYNDGERFRVVKDTEDNPATDKPSPWRVVIVGPLSQVVESTLVTDVSEPCKLKDTGWIKPGVVSWVYWAYNHGSNDYEIIKRYVDLAATLHLPYVLIDAEWDQMKDGKTIEDAIAYAKSKKIRPMIWYNSSVGWIDGAPTPKFRLNKPEDREREFAWCERLGVAGVKIDFFSGDTQRNMDYCIELMESAARHHLLVNFHGATIPRGWQRTYPNLLSTEGVYGAEWYNNVPTFTTKAAAHNATLPFTRNVIGPMDYTPCAFSDSQHPHITSHAHELALTVLFESGLQHLADRPESFLAQPKEVQQFLGHLPAAWDETRLLSGAPADHAVIARRSGKTWYIAGINGTDNGKTFSLDLGFIQRPRSVLSFTDSGATDSPWLISRGKELPKTMNCQPRGGFLLVVNPDF